MRHHLAFVYLGILLVAGCDTKHDCRWSGTYRTDVVNQTQDAVTIDFCSMYAGAPKFSSAIPADGQVHAAENVIPRQETFTDSPAESCADKSDTDHLRTANYAFLRASDLEKFQLCLNHPVGQPDPDTGYPQYDEKYVLILSGETCPAGFTHYSQAAFQCAEAE